MRGNKNNYNDALAIAEAVTQPEMRLAAIKTQAQQDIQALHRLQERTALCNQVRGLLAEYGIAIAKGVRILRHKLPECCYCMKLFISSADPVYNVLLVDKIKAARSNMKDSPQIPDLTQPFKAHSLANPQRPISFVVVKFCDEYWHNFMLSEAASCAINEVIMVDNTANLYFDNLTRAMQSGIDQAQHELIVVVHEDVLLPTGWQQRFEESLSRLEKQDPNWRLLSSVGWSEQGDIFGHWKDPQNELNSFRDDQAGHISAASCDEQILVLHRNRLPNLDLELPGIHHIGRDIPKQLGTEAGVYVIDAPTIHKYADKLGNRMESGAESEKIRDRESLTYLAERACCNNYIKHKWPDLEVKDYHPANFELPFSDTEKLEQLDQPIILLGKGGGGTRLLGSMAQDLGVFLGNHLNDSMDTEEMILPVYQGVVEKYRCFTGWQKQQIVPRLRSAAATMIKDLAADKPWGFKLPESLLLLPELLTGFPKARFIHMVRDPLDTCLRRTHMTARLDNSIGRITLPLAYDWVGRGRERILLDPPELHMAYTTLHQIYSVWDVLDKLDNEVWREVQFESLVKQPSLTTKSLCKWLKLEQVGFTTAAIADPGRASRDESVYPAALVSEVHSILSQLRNDLGYAVAPEKAAASDGVKEVLDGSAREQVKLVIILGMHRSGTSALAGLLNTMGVDFGSNLIEAQSDNPKGFFEDRDIYDFNEELLNYMGGEWFSLNTHNREFLLSPTLRFFVNRAITLIRKKTNLTAVYGIKDPRMCRLLPFWKHVFQIMGIAPIYLISLRNPLDVSLSLASRHGFDTEKSVRIWLRHYLDIMEEGDILSEALVVEYDQLLDNLEASSKHIMEYLGRACISIKRDRDISGGLDASLRHGKNNKELLSNVSEVRKACSKVYYLLRELSNSPASRDELVSRLLHLRDTTKMTAEWLSALDGAELLGSFKKSSEYISTLGGDIAELKKRINSEEYDKTELRHQKDEVIREKDEVIREIDDILRAQQELIIEKDRERMEFEQAIKNSLSWKVSAPLRLLRDFQVKLTGSSKQFIIVAQRMGFLRTLKYAGNVLLKEGVTGIKRRAKALEENNGNELTYQQWVTTFDTVSDASRGRFVAELNGLKDQPLISIVMPVYDPPVELLALAIDSVIDQIYPNWELCLADDLSLNEQVRELIRQYAVKDERIKYVFRKNNGHISKASNSALELVNGKFVALMDHDDLLPCHALYWVVEAINAHPEGKLFYSDEDKIDLDGVRHDPYFKSDWNPDLFLSHNMFSHLGVYDSALIKQLGGFREGMEGSQDYDLALRSIEQIDFSRVIHIPRVLYHWRVMPGSTALDASEKPYAMDAGERAINEHLARTGKAASCELLGWGYRVKYELTASPLVSIIIPTRDEVTALRTCISSILEKTTYDNYEIIIVDNGSVEQQTFSYLKELEQAGQVRVIRDDGEFNFSRINNEAVQHAKGEIIALVNNDVEVISPDWMTEMVSHATRPEVGAVGCRLIYPNNTLQHGGIILGLGGIAAYSHRQIPREAPGYFGRAMLLQSLSAVTAACLFVRKEVYQQVNGLDEENLAVAYNDVDFCLRIREAGYRNVFTPYAELIHYESQTRGPEDTPDKQKRLQKEYAYMRKRWGTLLDRDPAYNPNLTLDREDFSLASSPRVQHVV